MGDTDKQVVEYLDKNKDVWSEAADGKVEVYYYTKDTNDRYFATRKDLLSHMSKCTTMADAEKTIDSITDSGIRSILRAHLAAENNNPAEAFSADGLERMNHNIKSLNGDHNHMPIKKIRVYEKSAKKRQISNFGQKSTKYVEAADGTNLFFVIYLDTTRKRNYKTLPLVDVINLQKRYDNLWKEHIAEILPQGSSMLYILSPGDLVYVPEDGVQPTVATLNHNRIYKVVSCDDIYISCVPFSSAQPVLNKVEYESPNKMKTTIDKKYMIREVCIPIQVDRLGNITKIG